MLCDSSMKIKIGKSGLFAIVDSDDYERLKAFSWVKKTCHGGKFIYAKAGKKLNYITMHRFIVLAKSDQIVDHINGNTLDNRKQNLRVCSYSENALNKKPDSHYRGKKRSTDLKGIRKVFGARGTKYHVNAWDVKNKKRVFLGSFSDLNIAKNTYQNFMRSFQNDFVNSSLERNG